MNINASVTPATASRALSRLATMRPRAPALVDVTVPRPAAMEMEARGELRANRATDAAPGPATREQALKTIESVAHAGGAEEPGAGTPGGLIFVRA